MYFEDAHESSDWPPGMRFRITDSPALLELLWLRHAHLGNAEPSLPPADLPGAPVESEDVVLLGRWEQSWRDALLHARQVMEEDPTRLPGFAQLWKRPACPLAVALGVESRFRVDAWASELAKGAHGDAERAVPASAVRAWQAGLRVVVEVPVQGRYSRALSAATILVSRATRNDPLAYAEALDGFAAAS